jgi:hypothetical protein
MTDMGHFELELQRAEARGRLAALPDETLVPEPLAAIFLGLSEKQMKNLREKEDGPKFFKPLTKGSEKANTSAQYEMGELRRWRKEHTYESNLDAARKSGIMKWASEPQPYFVLNEHRGLFSILAPADDISRGDWSDRLATVIEGGNINVEWMIPADAAATRWKDLEEHRAFANEYFAAMNVERQRVESALNATDLGSLI